MCEGVKPAGIHHVNICVRDADEALVFYRDVMGMTVLDRPDFGFPGYWFDAGGEQLHLTVDADGVGHGHFAIRVTDIDDAVAAIREHDVRVDTIPATAGAGRQAFLTDPSGNIIELNQQVPQG